MYFIYLVLLARHGRFVAPLSYYSNDTSADIVFRIIMSDSGMYHLCIKFVHRVLVSLAWCNICGKNIMDQPVFMGPQSSCYHASCLLASYVGKLSHLPLPVSFNFRDRLIAFGCGDVFIKCKL